MNNRKRPQRRVYIGMILLGVISSGCGPSAKIMEAQENAVETEYQQAVDDLSKLPPKKREMRMRRMERDFGKRPELPTVDSPPK